MDAQHRRQQVGRRLFFLTFTTTLVIVAACGGSKSEVVAPSAARGAGTTAATTAAEVLPFIHDDYPKALAEAKRRNKPLFVDAWAPWCHSCQSLRAFVLTDPKLASLAPDFVWLSVDTEKSVNEEWVTRHPHSALPTLWVIDPATDRPILKWAGTATADELRALLSVSIADTRSGPEKGSGVEATAAFVRGNQALAAGDAETAEKEHRAALAAATKEHPHRARIVEAIVTQLSLRKQHERCAEIAAAEAGDLPAGTSRASTLVAGLACARDARANEMSAAETDKLFDLALRDARGRDASLLADDRSALYEEVVQTKKDRGGTAAAADALALADEWAKFLDGEAARAKTNDARASLDPLRLSAYLALNEPSRAIPMLEKSERDFPTDYNPPARLGRAYLEMKPPRLDDADKAADRAIARVYGPRVMRVLALKADIAKARGDRAGEIAALEQALARSEKAVLTEGQKASREGLAKRLAALK